MTSDEVYISIQINIQRKFKFTIKYYDHGLKKSLSRVKMHNINKLSLFEGEKALTNDDRNYFLLFP